MWAKRDEFVLFFAFLFFIFHSSIQVARPSEQLSWTAENQHSTRQTLRVFHVYTPVAVLVGCPGVSCFFLSKVARHHITSNSHKRMRAPRSNKRKVNGRKVSNYSELVLCVCTNSCHSDFVPFHGRSRRRKKRRKEKRKPIGLLACACLLAHHYFSVWWFWLAWWRASRFLFCISLLTRLIESLAACVIYSLSSFPNLSFFDKLFVYKLALLRRMGKFLEFFYIFRDGEKILVLVRVSDLK